MSDINPDTCDRLVRLMKESNMTQREVASELGWNQTEVSIIARSRGVSTQKRGQQSLSPEKRDKIRRLLEEGGVQDEIARTCRSSTNTVNAIALGRHDPDWHLRKIEEYDVAQELRDDPVRVKLIIQKAFRRESMTDVAQELHLPLNLINAVRESTQCQRVWENWLNRDGDME